MLAQFAHRLQDKFHLAEKNGRIYGGAGTEFARPRLPKEGDWHSPFCHTGKPALRAEARPIGDAELVLMKTVFAIVITALGVAQLFAGPGRAAPPRMAAPHLPAMSHPQIELQPRIAPEPQVETPRLDESRRNREMEATHERIWAARPQPAQERLQQPEVRREEAQRQQQQQAAQQRLSFAEARQRTSLERHDRAWWERRHNGIFRAGSGYYFLDTGYWYPAFGYDPAVDTYASNDPMCALADLTPDQEIATVQTALQEDGYYSGSITGALDTTTLEAIAKFQTANGLLATGAIDQPTLEALGLT